MTYTDPILRGDIFMLDLDPTKGSEQKGIRPVLVIQNNASNRTSPTTIVATITGAEHIVKPYPIMVKVDAGEGGLTKDSYVDCAQIRTIDVQKRLIKKLGSLNPDIMAQVDKAIKISLALK